MGECPREDCKKARAVRDEALFVAEEAAAQLYAMREQMQSVLEQLEGKGERAGAAAMQHALLAILDGEELSEHEEEPEEPEESESEPASAGAPTGRDRAASSDREQVREEHEEEAEMQAEDGEISLTATRVGHSKGALGTLTLREDALLWQLATAFEPELLQLAQARTLKLEKQQVSPFYAANRLSLSYNGSLLAFDLVGFESDARSFVDRLEAAAAAAASAAPALAAAAVGGASPGPSSAPPAPSVPAAPWAANPAAAASGPVPRPTKRFRVGRKLRDELLEVNRLRKHGGVEEAAELARSLEQETASADKVDGLARKRVRELSDAAFSFGGLELTRQVVRRFCSLPEVRPLLTPEVLERQRDVADGETARQMIKAAKGFFSQLMKAPRGEKSKRGGRRTDDERNAYAAALAALLPKDLFENRRGRAAMRLLGLTSYRQAKRGTDTRGAMEDRGGGWKRIKTSEHYNKARRAPTRSPAAPHPQSTLTQPKPKPVRCAD